MIISARRWLSKNGGGAVALNRALVGCNTLEELNTLVLQQQQQQAHLLTAVNVATAIHRMGRLAKFATPTPTTPTAFPYLLSIAKPQKFEARAISNMCHGIAMGKLRDDTVGGGSKFPEFLQTQAVDKARFFTPQEVSNLLWSFAVQEEHAPQVFNEFSKQICFKLARFSPRDLSTSLWSFAVLGHANHHVLFDRAKAHILSRTLHQQPLQAYNAQDLSSLLFSFATLGHPHSADLCSAVAAQAMDIRMNSSQSLLLLVWSLACLDALGLHKVREMFQTMRMPTNITLERTVLQANQLHFCRLAWDQVNPGVQSVLLDDLESPKGWVREKRATQLNYGYQSRLVISQQLTQAFSQRSEQVLVNAETSSGMQVDFYLPERNFAVEIEGKHNYAYDGITPLGHTLFKHRLLTRQGISLCKIHVSDFCKHTPAEQHDLLQEIVQHVISTTPPPPTPTASSTLEPL